MIDDGFDYNHSDLAAPYDEGLDFDFDANNNGDGVNDFDPFGQATDSHGTAVMGIIGANNNGTGAVGVAFDSNLIGYRVHGFINDGWLQDVRDAIHFGALNARADVANISQGIANDEDSEFGIGYNAVRFDEIETSIGTAVNQGRNNLGMTIVKSAGNSRADNYDVNADDWSNDTRQVVVAAVDQNGYVSSYSSYGAAVLVSGFGTPGQVVTTDRTGAAGYNSTDFTSGFNGTSAAAPMVSGVVALMYDANAALGWRDVQSILANSARNVGSNVGSGIAGSERYPWQWNAAATWNGGGLHFSNDYGYGLVDARAAVRLAESWLLTSLSAQTSPNEFSNTMDMLNAATVIPTGLAGTTFTGTAFFDDEVERVTVQMTFSTTWTADLELYVTSPDGTVSELIADNGGDSDFNGTWTFESQAFRGERAAGTWSVRVVDDAGGDPLTVSDIVVRAFGRFSTSDRYVYTDEFSNYAGIGGHTTALADINGGSDTINAAAVSSNSTINLNAGGATVIDGVAMTVGAGIEHAFGGDGNDTVIGNNLANTLFGGRGNDGVTGGRGSDRFGILAPNTGVDLFHDFSIRDGDRVALAHDGFGISGTGTLAATGVGFALGSGATGAFRSIVYDGANVFWDSDGTGAAPKVQLATTTNPIQGIATPSGAGWNVVATGDFNLDAQADLMWRNPTTGETAGWLMGNGAAVATPFYFGTTGYTNIGSGDFDGNGTTDVLWREDATGNTAAWFMSGGAVGSHPFLLNASGWEVVATGKFDGNATTDILWKNSSTGQTAAWLMTPGTGAISSTPFFLGAAGWDVVGTGQFDSGGTTDILWKEASTGNTAEWLMVDGAVGSHPFLLGAGGWEMVATGRFDANATTDVLWANVSTGQTAAWLMTASGAIGSTPFYLNTAGWTAVSAGDFDRNGATDILWKENATGAVASWLFADGAVAATPFYPSGSGYEVVAGGDLDDHGNLVDFNGDGAGDAIWQNLSNGTTVDWTFNHLNQNDFIVV